METLHRYMYSLLDVHLFHVCTWVMLPSSLLQPCSDNLASMAYISVNSLLNTLFFLKQHL